MRVHSNAAYVKNGNILGAKNIRGGGPLSLSKQSVENLLLALVKNRIITRSCGAHRLFSILWIGIGYGEEAALVSIVLSKLKIPHKIIGVDIASEYLQCVENLFQTNNVLDNLLTRYLDINTVAGTDISQMWLDRGVNSIDLFYTSAAFDDITALGSMMTAVCSKVSCSRKNNYQINN